MRVCQHDGRLVYWHGKQRQEQPTRLARQTTARTANRTSTTIDTSVNTTTDITTDATTDTATSKITNTTNRLNINRNADQTNRVEHHRRSGI